MIRLLRLYQSPKGIWRYDFLRDGGMRWSSLHTRHEHIAKLRYKQIKAMLEAKPKEKP